MAIIRCPHCGQKISSQAFTCPGCNAPINTPSTNISPDKDQENTNQREQSEAKPKGCGRGLVLIAVVLLLVGIATGGVMLYMEQRAIQKQKILEELRYRIAQDEKANAERLLEAQMDSASWRKALMNKSIELTEEYINDYPEGIFINEAYMLLEQLRRRQLTEAERGRINLIVDSTLNIIQNERLSHKETDVLGMHYNIEGTLKIQKHYISNDSLQYIVRAVVSETINRTNPTKPHNSSLNLELLIDKDFRIISMKET